MKFDVNFKNKIYDVCGKFFTKNEVDVYLVSDKRANKWFNGDFVSSIALKTRSSKYYKYVYLRNRLSP